MKANVSKDKCRIISFKIEYQTYLVLGHHFLFVTNCNNFIDYVIII